VDLHMTCLLVLWYTPIIETKNSNSYYIILLPYNYQVKIFMLGGNWTLHLLNTHSSVLTRSSVIKTTRLLGLKAWSHKMTKKSLFILFLLFLLLANTWATFSRSWEKCKEEQYFGLWKLFAHHHLRELRLSLVLSLFISILTKLADGIIFEYYCFPSDMLSILSWMNIISKMLILTTWPHLNLWIDNNLRSRVL